MKALVHIMLNTEIAQEAKERSSIDDEEYEEMRKQLWGKK